MGVFDSIYIRHGFGSVYRPESILPPTITAESVNTPYDTQLASGTGSGKCDIEHIMQYTLAASANITLDLRGGLTDRFGNTLQFVSVKGIWIKASPSNVNNVIFKPSATDSFLAGFGAAAHQFSIPPGGLFMVTHPAAGWAPGAAASDDIYFENSGAGSSVVFDFHIIGSTA